MPRGILDPVTQYFQDPGNSGNHLRRLEALNAQIPAPMHNKCNFSVVIPAYKEGESLERSLSLLADQKGPNGKLLDPNSYELLVMMNRPNRDLSEEEAFAKSRAAIERVKEKHPNLVVHPIETTFDFKTKTNGKPDVRMGTVFKTAADLALHRLQKRDGYVDPHTLADHLIMTTGADYEGRPETFIHQVRDEFQDRNLVLAKPRIDLPPEAYKKYPFLHVTNKLFTGMIDRLHDPRFNPDPNTHQRLPGESIFSAETYVRSGGFNPNLPIAEDIDLVNKMRKHGDVRRIDGLTVHTSPRRRLSTLSKGRTLLNTYSNFASPSALIRKSGVSDEELGRLDKDRLEAHMTKFYNFLQSRLYHQLAASEDYELADIKTHLKEVKRNLHNAASSGLSADNLAEFATAEAERERRLSRDGGDADKYLDISEKLRLSSGKGLKDPKVIHQAKRILTLMRRRLGAQRSAVLDEARDYASNIFRDALVDAGVDGFTLHEPKTLFDKSGNMRDHRVTIDPNHFKRLKTRVHKYKNGQRNSISIRHPL